MNRQAGVSHAITVRRYLELSFTFHRPLHNDPTPSPCLHPNVNPTLLSRTVGARHAGTSQVAKSYIGLTMAVVHCMAANTSLYRPSDQISSVINSQGTVLMCIISRFNHSWSLLIGHILVTTPRTPSLIYSHLSAPITQLPPFGRLSLDGTLRSVACIAFGPSALKPACDLAPPSVLLLWGLLPTTSHSIFYSRVGQIAIFSHCEP